MLTIHGSDATQSGVQRCKMFLCTSIYFKPLFRLPGNLFSRNSESQPTGLVGEIWSLVTAPHACFPFQVPINLLGFCQQRWRLHFLLPSSRPLQICLICGYFCSFLGQLENLPVPHIMLGVLKGSLGLVVYSPHPATPGYHRLLCRLPLASASTHRIPGGGVVFFGPSTPPAWGCGGDTPQCPWPLPPLCLHTFSVRLLRQ